MAKIKFTPMQQAFRKEQKRLKKAIQREFRKTGVELDRELIPEMPQRVTKKQLENIKNIKLKDLRRETQYVDYETGEILDYNRAKELWDKEQKYSPPVQGLNEYQVHIQNFRTSYSKFNDDFQNKMDTWLRGLISEYGEKVVASMLMDGAADGLIVTYREAYSDTMLSQFQAEMLNYLNLNARDRAEVLASIEEQIGYEEPE